MVVPAEVPSSFRAMVHASCRKSKGKAVGFCRLVSELAPGGVDYIVVCIGVFGQVLFIDGMGQVPYGNASNWERVS